MVSGQGNNPHAEGRAGPISMPALVQHNLYMPSKHMYVFITDLPRATEVNSTNEQRRYRNGSMQIGGVESADHCKSPWCVALVCPVPAREAVHPVV